MKNIYDVCVIGGGACGLVASIFASQDGTNVLLLEKLPNLATKLKATGGGRCNLANHLDNESFINSFGKGGRFIQDAIKEFDSQKTIEFFSSIRVETHSPDGFRVFPTTHNSTTIIQALSLKIQELGVESICNQKVIDITKVDEIFEIITQTTSYKAHKVIIATGGNGYPQLGSTGDGYTLAKKLSHKITSIYPAMMPLKTKETWVEKCRADTIAKVTLKVDIKKHSKLQACGDLIFTRDGIRGPVVLDFSREITPLFDKYDTIPLLANFTKGMSVDDIIKHLKTTQKANPTYNTLQLVETLLPTSLSLELCRLADIEPNLTLAKQKGLAKDRLYKLLAWTPLSITGHDGFDKAMVTRGGVSTKEIDPKTMQSKKVDGLYFCGEVVDIDGPCGGFNLQWAFASGYLAGTKIPI